MRINPYPQSRYQTRHPVAVTALLYLKEAGARGRSEEGPVFVEIAKEFGVPEADIRQWIHPPTGAFLAA